MSIALLCPGIKAANSPEKLTIDFFLVSINGSISTNLVKAGTSFLKPPSNPSIVFEIGSSPALTLGVRGLSFNLRIVAPILASLLIL